MYIANFSILVMVSSWNTTRSIMFVYSLVLQSAIGCNSNTNYFTNLIICITITVINPEK